MTDGSTYTMIARSRAEVDQPSISARALEPFTRSFLLEAGIGQGMRILDMCSGTGDLAFLAREMVGPEGHVTGVDPTPQAANHARERAAFRGLANVEFVDTEMDGLPAGEQFDAIIGRAVLMYRTDPAYDLRTLMRHLRPGGIVAFQDFDLLAAKTLPPSPLIEQVRDWLFDTFAGAGIELEMGPKLHATFVAAGLPPPRMRVDGLIGGVDSVGPTLVANVARTLFSQLDTRGAAGADIETLEERMRAELAATGGVLLAPLLISAWSKRH